MRLFDDIGAGFGRAADTGQPLIVDSFAGGGGASTGIEMALGRSPDIAINHDADALALHEVNHPATLHLSKNIWHVDPFEAVGNRRVGLAWFSPDCKHFSKAKGGRPVKRNIRDLAWVVVLWAKRARPAVIILENVEEFQDWGPLVEREPGKWVPCPERKGQTFRKWVSDLKRLGYRVEFRQLRACDYGAPTIRKRFFMVARCDGLPITWPEPTHGSPDDPDVIAGRKKPWRTAAEIIDWSLPCPSIFDTAEEIFAKFGVRAIRPLAEATMKRIARGVVRYVLEAKKPFIVVANHGGDHFRGQGLEEPTHVVTAARDAWGLVVPSLVGCGGRAGQSAPRGGDQPLGTQTAKADGCVVAAHLTKFQTGSTGSGCDEPVPTVTANSFIKRPGGAAPIGVVAATMVQTGYGERDGQAPRALDIGKPLGTQVAGGAKHGVVAAFLAQHNNDTKPNGTDFPRAGRAATAPVGTLTTSPQQSVVAAYLAQHNTDMVGHARSPVSTIVQKGCTQGVVAAHLSHFYTSNTRGGEGDPVKPLRTDTAGGQHAALISGFLTKYYGQGDGAAVTGPLHTDTTKDRFGLVTVDIDGATYAIADIGMRMLTPRERFRAQGFPDSYIIDRRPDGSRITQTVQGRCCGNSVCPPLASALVSANCGHLAMERQAAE